MRKFKRGTLLVAGAAFAAALLMQADSASACHKKKRGHQHVAAPTCGYAQPAYGGGYTSSPMATGQGMYGSNQGVWDGGNQGAWDGGYGRGMGRRGPLGGMGRGIGFGNGGYGPGFGGGMGGFGGGYGPGMMY